MKEYVSLTLLLFILLNVNAKEKQKATSIAYPITKKINHTDTYFGTTIEDPYQWLEDDTSTATKAWVEEQNKVTFDYLDKIPYRQQLKDRFKQLYQFTKLSKPVNTGKYIFYSKAEALENQRVIFIRKGISGTPEVFINPNLIDKSGLTSVTLLAASEDEKYIGASFQKSGSDWIEIKIYDIENRQQLSDNIQWSKTSYIAWYKDGFFYSRYPKPESNKELSQKNENHAVYYHKLGDLQENDALVYQDSFDPLTFNLVTVSDDNQYQFLYKYKGTYGNEIYWKKSDDASWEFKPLLTGYQNQSSVIDVINGQILINTDTDAPKGKLVAINPLQPESENWKTIIPENKNTIESAISSGGKIIVLYLENASNKLVVFDIDGKNRKEIALPGPGTIDLSQGGKTIYDVFYTYQSFTYPTSIFYYNTLTGYSQLFKKPELNFNTDIYESKQVWYKSKDGTKVSMFIVHKKGIPLNKKNPTYLYSYGGFNQMETPVFSASRILLLENGGVLAIPNLRGGGEYGNDWHKAGMLMNKQNVFDDFIAAAQYLIKQKYTSSDKLGIAGGSNGGLLVGACMTQRPDLFKVALPSVGVLDMLKFHRFTIGWGWVVEYGSSEQSKEMFEYLRNYSPYHNLKPQTSYPATMIITADHDDRVVPAHSFKFAARLQEYHNKSNPALIRIGVNAGHGAGKPTSKIIEEVADYWSFYFWNIGMKQLKQ